MNSIRYEAGLVPASFHGVFLWMMNLVKTKGYFGVAFLMALESSIIPLPSEVVIPPAAYWASQGEFNVYLVIVAGAFGSWVGSAVSYWLSYAIGRPLVIRYGKYLGFTEEKVKMAEEWVRDYGTGGVFFARLLPVIRHLISIPAGICRMPFAPFSAATFVGAGLWCGVLAWFGPRIITAPMLEDADRMVAEIKHQTHYIVGLVALMAVLYAVQAYMSKRGKSARLAAAQGP